MAGNGEHRRQESSVQPGTWEELDRAIQSKDILTILGMQKETPRDVPHVKEAIKARLELLRALGNGHKREIEAHYRRCLTAGQELLKKTANGRNGNGHHSEKETAPEAVKDVVRHTRETAAGHVPQAVDGDAAEPVGIKERALTWIKNNRVTAAVGATAASVTALFIGHVAFSGKPAPKEIAHKDVTPPAAVSTPPIGAPVLKQSPLPVTPAFDP
ncbi:MAG: hypothetical protein PHO54_06290, partial [Candidatus Peribacteraceae bacterium]|nr:hypothetical protein [Candidatus Peribacteraceae bacterium]